MSIGMARVFRRTSSYARTRRARLNLYAGALCLASGLALIFSALIK